MSNKPAARGQFTPGPWTIDQGEIIAGGMVLGTVYGAEDYPCEEEDVRVECVANARLIAAAPDLLEACAAALAILHSHISPDNFDGHAARALILVRYALAKAKGEA